MDCGAMIRLEPGDQSKQVNPAALRGPEGLVMWLRVYPAPAEKGGGSASIGHTIARETCVHRQACKHAEHGEQAWWETRGARGHVCRSRALDAHVLASLQAATLCEARPTKTSHPNWGPRDPESSHTGMGSGHAPGVSLRALKTRNHCRGQ